MVPDLRRRNGAGSDFTHRGPTGSRVHPLGGGGARVERLAGANQNCPQEQDLEGRSDCKRLCGVHLEVLEQEVGEGEEQTR